MTIDGLAIKAKKKRECSKLSRRKRIYFHDLLKYRLKADKIKFFNRYVFFFSI